MKKTRLYIASFLTLIFIILSILVKLDLVSSIDTFIYNLCTFKMHYQLYYL